MIKKIILNNIMSWKGTTEIIYKDWIILFNWKYWAWKSSLLVDSLDLVFSNKARENISEIITKGEASWNIEVFLDVNWIDYKIYWFHQPKSEIEVIWKKWKKKNKKVSAITEWKTFQKDENTNEFYEIHKTPEDILWIPYEIAKKTFIIWQHDLAKFSESWPSEKYEIIADAFWISTLFKIWEKSNEKIKNKIIEKNLLIKNLDWVNTSDFDEIPDLEKNTIEKKEEYLKYVKNWENLLKEKEELIELKNDNNNLNQFIENNNFLNKELIWFNQIDISLEEKKIKELELKLEKEDISKIEKEEEILNSLNNDKISKEVLYKNKIENFIDNWNNKLWTLKEKILEISKKFQEITIENIEYFQNEENQKLIISYWNKEKYIEENNTFFENINNENLLINQNNYKLQTLNQEIEKLNWILINLKNISNSTCPTCHRPVSNEDFLIIETNFKKEIKIKNEEIKKNQNEIWIKTKNIENIKEKIQKNEKIIFEIETLIQVKEKSELWSKWKELQIEYKGLKDKFEQDKKCLEDEFFKENQKVVVLIQKQDNKIKKLKENNKYYEIKEELQKEKNKFYNVNWTNYNLSDLKVYKHLKEKQLEENNKKITEINNKYKEKSIDWSNIEQKIEKNIIDYNKNNEIKEEINEDYINLKNKYDKIVSLKKEYDKIKIQLDIINKKLEQLEKISFIFWKKWEPKNIIENIIVPQLEWKTNNILNQMTNWTYNIEFSLNSITADWNESKKNIFDIIVYQNWIPQTYNLLSWWERTNVNFAIRLWITECLNDLLWRKVNDFLILDETFNAVDAQEWWDELIKWLLEIYNSNRFQQIFIITHVTYIKDRLEDIWNVINIEKRWKYSQIY